MQPLAPSIDTPDSLVIAAMHDAVIAAGLAYHGPLARTAVGRALDPGVVWTCAGRILRVSVCPEHHARMTDDRRVAAWRWLLGMHEGAMTL